MKEEEKLISYNFFFKILWCWSFTSNYL